MYKRLLICIKKLLLGDNKSELLIKYLDSTKDYLLSDMQTDDLCYKIQEEALCYGIDCEDCPLKNMAVLKEAVQGLVKGV